MKKIALITGITGQDGSYLAELLLSKNYEVHGVKRRTSFFNTTRIDRIYESLQNKKKKFFLHFGDLNDASFINKIVSSIKPDEIYNLAAQSHVAVSFQIPEYTSDVNALGTIRILEAIKNFNLTKTTKFYQASTSELFGGSSGNKFNEKTVFYPKSPYGVAKLYAYWITVNYRESYGLFACNGILFNHESPRRGETFVSRKITRGLVSIFCGIEKHLYMGNLDSKRDWGHAKDYVYMQWLMMQQKKPKDYVIATGKQYTVRDFIVQSAKTLGFTIKFRGKGLKELGYISKINKKSAKHLKIGQTIIKIDQAYFRPSEVNSLLGDSSLAKKELKWKTNYNFKDLIKEMINFDLNEISKIKKYD